MDCGLGFRPYPKPQGPEPRGWEHVVSVSAVLAVSGFRPSGIRVSEETVYPKLLNPGPFWPSGLRKSGLGPILYVYGSVRERG